MKLLALLCCTYENFEIGPCDYTGRRILLVVALVVELRHLIKVMCGFSLILSVYAMCLLDFEIYYYLGFEIISLGASRRNWIYEVLD